MLTNITAGKPQIASTLGLTSSRVELNSYSIYIRGTDSSLVNYIMGDSGLKLSNFNTNLIFAKIYNKLFGQLLPPLLG